MWAVLPENHHLIMQMVAHVINLPVKINNSEQTSALGAAMFATLVGGVYPKVEEAMSATGQALTCVDISCLLSQPPGTPVTRDFEYVRSKRKAIDFSG